VLSAEATIKSPLASTIVCTIAVPEIFDAAIAAEGLTFASTIVSLAIIVDVTVPMSEVVIAPAAATTPTQPEPE
jgi:hypothetical protein